MVHYFNARERFGTQLLCLYAGVHCVVGAKGPEPAESRQQLACEKGDLDAVKTEGSLHYLFTHTTLIMYVFLKREQSCSHE